MEYVQMTLNEWLEMKQSLERELSNLKTGFIRVGYVLRKIDDTKGYEQDGYKSVAEFAKAEYGLSASTVSRFMAINEKFSLDGYSERLDPKYIGFRQSIMGEMLGLPDQDLDLVTPETSRQDVRELKQFNKQEPEKGIADDLRNLIESYFRENRDELNELYNAPGTPTQEILNPSGNKVYRKGMYMMFFYTDCVKTKRFGGATDAYNWEEFRGLIDSIFSPSAGQDTYGNYFGIPQQTEAPEAEEPKPAEVPRAEEPKQEEPKEEKKPETETIHKPAPMEPEKKPAPKKPEKKVTVQDPDEDMPIEAEESAEAEGTGLEEAEVVEHTAHEETQEAEGAEQEETPAETIAPAQIMPAPEPTIYSKAVADAGEKLEEIRQSYEEQDWMRMSEQLLSLGFVVNQLKVMQTMHA